MSAQVCTVILSLSTWLIAGSSPPIQPAPDPELVPTLTISAASHFDLGNTLGGRFKDEISTAMSKDAFFHVLIVPYSKTHQGAAIYNRFLNAVRKTYPQYLDEVSGMANGSGIDFSRLFLWNIKTELNLLLKKKVPVDSCSDIYLKDTAEVVMGHNEDNGLSSVNTTFLVHAQVQSTDGHMPLENFTAFCYAGMLCGTAFGFNPTQKTVYSVNALFPKTINPDAIGRNFLLRAVMSLPYDEVPNVLTRVRCSSGFSLNIGDLDTLKISNIEVSPDGAVHTEYGMGTGYHFNMYLHSDVDQVNDSSSLHRLERVKELPPPSDAMDILKILGDTGDRDYPIYRRAIFPDEGKTLATGMFDLNNRKMYIFKGNPCEVTPQKIVPI